MNDIDPDDLRVVVECPCHRHRTAVRYPPMATRQPRPWHGWCCKWHEIPRAWLLHHRLQRLIDERHRPTT